MTDTPKNLSPAKAEREKTLALDRQNILAMPPEKALDTVAEHPYPVTLIQSFAEEDLYLLVHTIGPDDALPILGLASNEQWEYFLDMDVWKRDRVDPLAMTQWLDRLLKADADRFTHWICHEKADDLSYYLYQNIEVVLREHDQDPSDLGEGFFTEDQTHFVRLRKIDSASGVPKQYEEDRDTLVTDLLKRISIYDYPRYVGLLLESTALLPTETEEELYRLRSIRLAEKGFIPHEEAIGVYQPLSVSQLLTRPFKTDRISGRRLEAYPLPVIDRAAPQGANRFTRSLAKIQDENVYQRLQSEFAGLCNQTIAADQIIIREKTSLNKVVAKVSDFISLGLEKIALETGDPSPYADSKLIQTHFLGDLFRVGYGCALELKWKAQRWHKSAWFFRQGFTLTFWGEYGLGLLGGILLKKPLRYTPAGRDGLYAEFSQLDQIQAAHTALDTLIAFDKLLEAMNVTIGPGQSSDHLQVPGTLTYINMLLTLWAHSYLREPDTVLQPLQLDTFRRLFTDMWQPEVDSPTIKTEVKQNFLRWLARRSGRAESALTIELGAALDELFHALESELGHVESRHLDPRFIQLFIIAGPGPRP